MPKKSSEKTVLIISLIIIIVFVSLQIFNNSTYMELVKEDGFVENVTALFFILSSILFFSSKKKVFTIFMGFLCLFFFMEEVSYGQRIFNYETPEILSRVNVQGEINLHNFSFIHSHELIVFLVVFIFVLLLPMIKSNSWLGYKRIYGYRWLTMLLALSLCSFDLVRYREYGEVMELVMSFVILNYSNSFCPKIKKLYSRNKT